MAAELEKKNSRLASVLGIVALCLAITLGLHHLTNPDTVTVVKESHDNGMHKEVWLYERSIFKNGDKIKELIYFENGKKYSEVDYKKGKVNGWARMWYESGQLHMEATYEDSKTHGLRIAYHENGQMFCRAEYDHGELLRKKNWDEEGNEIYLPIDR